jgi:hypothetical protein
MNKIIPISKKAQKNYGWLDIQPYTPVSSCHIWTVGHCTGRQCSVVLSCLCCVASGWCLIGLRGCPLGPCRVSAACLLLSEPMLLTEPDLSPSLPRIGGGGEVMCRSSACDEGKEERSWPTPASVLGLGPRSLARPRSFGHIPTHVPWVAREAD